MTLLVIALATAVVAAVRGMWSPCGLSMLSSLNPVSESARGNRFWITAIWYFIGAVVGGALLGAGCAVVAVAVGRVGLSSSVTWALVAAAALVAFLSDTRVFGRSLPDHPRQVDERWLVRYRRWIYASGYGVQIGAGFATYIMTAAVYLTAALAVLTGWWLPAFAIGMTFGAARGLTILVAAGARTPERLRGMHWRLAVLAGPSLGLAIAGEAIVVGAAAWQLAGPVATSVLAVVTLVGLAALQRHVRRVALQRGHERSSVFVALDRG
jgi:hypothetical protein